MQFIEDHEAGPRRWYGGAVGDARLRRLDEHRPDAAHRAHPRRRGGGPDRRDAAVRLGPGRRGTRDQAEGEGAAGGAREAGAAPAGAGRLPRQRIRRGGCRRRSRPGPAAGAGCGCCWSTTRTRSCTRWPATSGSRARRSPRCGPGSRRRCSTTMRPTWWCCRRAPGARPTSAARAARRGADEREIPAFGVCLGLQAMVEHAGGNARPAGHAVARQAGHGPGSPAVELFAGLPAEFTAGRYHSLHATPDQVTGGFTVTAVTADPAASQDGCARS